MSTKAEKAEQAEAIEYLREAIKPGDTVYTILRHVSRSGMQRSISVVVMTEKNGPRDVSYLVARAGLGALDRRNDGVKVRGCGTDMGFHLVYNLAYTLFAGRFGCIGEGCPSNDHVNGDGDYTPHGLFGEDGRPEAREPYPGEIADGCKSHMHSNAGYALIQRWL